MLTALLLISSPILAQNDGANTEEDDGANATVSTQYRCSIAAKGEIFMPFVDADRFVVENNGMQTLNLSESEANAVRELVRDKAGCIAEVEGDLAIKVVGPFFARAVILPTPSGEPDEKGDIIIRFDIPVEVESEDDA